MTAYEKFIAERSTIAAAIATAGITKILYNKDTVPTVVPCAIVILEEETGKNGTSRRYVDSDLSWSVYLITDAQKAADPDASLYDLKEKFRTAYQTGAHRDIPSIEYYTSRLDGARLVRIAKLNLTKPGVGAGS